LASEVLGLPGSGSINTAPYSWWRNFRRFGVDKTTTGTGKRRGGSIQSSLHDLQAFMLSIVDRDNRIRTKQNR